MICSRKVLSDNICWLKQPCTVAEATLKVIEPLWIFVFVQSCPDEFGSFERRINWHCCRKGELSFNFDKYFHIFNICFLNIC